MTPVKTFYYDTEPFLLPYGTAKKNDHSNWALYYNPFEDVSFLVTRGKLKSRLGWRVRIIQGEYMLSSAEHFVRTQCGECLGL